VLFFGRAVLCILLGFLFASIAHIAAQLSEAAIWDYFILYPIIGLLLTLFPILILPRDKLRESLGSGRVTTLAIIIVASLFWPRVLYRTIRAYRRERIR